MANLVYSFLRIYSSPKWKGGLDIFQGSMSSTEASLAYDWHQGPHFTVSSGLAYVSTQVKKNFAEVSRPIPLRHQVTHLPKQHLP
jgi:hypothetical protein